MPVLDLRSTAILLEEGRTGEARLILEELVVEVPTHVAAHVLLAKIAESEKAFDSALTHWQRAYALNPQSRVIELGLRREMLRTISSAKRDDAVRSDELDLDHLIRELEAARIIPDPDIDAISEEALEDDLEDLVSETLARIYAAQKHFDEAEMVYRTLARQQPERRNEFETKAIEMEKLASENE